MATTTFEAISGELYGPISDPLPGLSYCVRLSRGESIATTTQEDFSDLAGRVALYADTNREREKDGIGVIGYTAGHSGGVHDSFPSSYLIQVFIPRSHFDELLAGARQGRLPSKLAIGVEGMDDNGQLAHAGKKWDNKATSHLRIVSFEYTLPLFTSTLVDEFEKSLAKLGVPPTRKQFDQLAQRVDSQAMETKAGLRALWWAVVIVGLLLLFVILRQ